MPSANPTQRRCSALNSRAGTRANCFSGNTEIGGGRTQGRPAGAADGTPGVHLDAGRPGSSSNPQFLTEVLCDSQVELGGNPSPCPSGQYPRETKIDHALAADQAAEVDAEPVRRGSEEPLVHRA